jgi:hypothetical protein
MPKELGEISQKTLYQFAVVRNKPLKLAEIAGKI